MLFFKTALCDLFLQSYKVVHQGIVPSQATKVDFDFLANH
jgi:hypothetical protein